jgi:hypothetical protein
MWKRIGPVAVASGSLVAGSSAAGWIVAHAEYCQYGGYISVEKCGVYEVAQQRQRGRLAQAESHPLEFL